MSPIDYDLVRALVYMRAEEAIKAARSDGRDCAYLEIWRDICPGGIAQPAFETNRQIQDAYLAAARHYVRSVGRNGITAEIEQRDNGRAYEIDLNLKW
jgi:hypothetical protein